ncbi:MAG: Glu-tRNA(Gln) amidotransferase subunit GatE [Candidatus Thorarchaeota archaeon]
MEADRYEKLGLMVGLELHQQLNTSRKLYCHCPPVVRDDDPHGRFVRRLRPTQSEMGQVDPAALFEFQQNKRFSYEYYNDTTCLVEADEEPPHNLCEEAIDISLIMANFLESIPVNEIHPMRKIVIDGSNTTGFQRTCITATGGSVLVGEKVIGIQTICLEEDAARKMGEDEKENTRTYRLDRLGIPLIEVATAPDIRTPKEAQETALVIGRLLRSTGRVKRGLGTIRQDVNVSIKNGAIIEIKGFQQLEMLAELVELEAQRQERLLEIRDVLVRRGITIESITNSTHDVSEIFAETEAKVLKRALASGEAVFAVKLPGFAGQVGRELQPDRRLGTEFSDYAKFWGRVGGIFHTDELPRYGITDAEVSNLRKHVGASDRDAVVIVAASKDRCIDALQAVLGRAREAVKGVPTETRTPLPDGTTKYARPRPGAERMYPETDVRPVKITDSWLERIKKAMPETLAKKEQRYVKELGLSMDLARQMTNSLNVDLFEFILDELKISPTLVAVTLENTLVSMHRDGIPTENIADTKLLEIFKAVTKNEMSSEALPEIIAYVANNPSATIQEALSKTGLGKIEVEDIEQIIRRIVEERLDFVHERGEAAVGGLMGVAMQELRGKADGKLVKDLLTSEVKRVLGQ